MHVSIIGGGGLVGSSAGFALQLGGVVSEIDLIDVNTDKARGEALDLWHGAPFVADQRIRAGGYELIPASDLVCITAGLRRKPDESRLDLINRNVALFLDILTYVAAAGLRPDAIVLVVSNPVDVLTYLAASRLGLPSRQVIGLGTTLDSTRFRALIAQSLDLPPTQVCALILGEHGDSMVPIWSAAQAAGLPLDKFPGWSAHRAEEIFKRTRGSGAEVIKLKGGAGFAVGVAIAEVVHAIARDSKRILPVGTLLQGPYGMRDVCLSVPTVLGRAGAERVVEIDLWPKEIAALRHSAAVLRETIDPVLQANPEMPVARPSPSAAQHNTTRQPGSPRVTISGARTGG